MLNGCLIKQKRLDRGPFWSTVKKVDTVHMPGLRESQKDICLILDSKRWTSIWFSQEEKNVLTLCQKGRHRSGLH